MITEILVIVGCFLLVEIFKFIFWKKGYDEGCEDTKKLIAKMIKESANDT